MLQLNENWSRWFCWPVGPGMRRIEHLPGTPEQFRQILIWFRDANQKPMSRSVLERTVRQVSLEFEGKLVVQGSPFELLWLHRHQHGWVKDNPWERGLVPISFGEYVARTLPGRDHWYVRCDFADDCPVQTLYAEVAFLEKAGPLTYIVKRRPRRRSRKRPGP